MNQDCPPDDQLLALATDEPLSSAVRGHVDLCDKCQRRVKSLRKDVAELRALSASPVASLEPTVIGDTEKARSTLPNGSSIGRYVIAGSLGSGGQAEVYRVIDPDLGRDLVLKLSHRRSFNGDGTRDALVAEGRLLAQLDHPGLVRVFEIGIHDERPFLVLDYVPGRNLEQIYATSRPPLFEATRLIAEVTRVVDYAHHRGVVHGDITPRNILIDSHGRTRLIDFGLSKIEDAWREDVGPTGGTPQFLPPEIVPAFGQVPESVPAGDVFGLGATFYWLLTGHAPFDAPTTLQALARARSCDIDFDALHRAGVPRKIATICRQALSANPNHRPTADVFAATLQRASRRWIIRIPVGTIAAIVLVGCALVWAWIEYGENVIPKPPSIVHSVPRITVDGIRNLSNVVPLRTGDRIAISCNISPGEKATLLWFNAAGELSVHSPIRDITDKVDRMVFPAPHEELTLEPPEGTDMLFFCRGEPVSADVLRDSFPIGTPPPRLPSHNYLELLRGELTLHGHLERTNIASEIHQVETTMKEINRQLMKHFQGVTGIAFSHHSSQVQKTKE